MPTITIDNKEYELDYLSAEAKAQLASLQFVDAELQRLSAQTAVLQTARMAYKQGAATVLPLAVVFQRFQAVPRRHSQAVQLGGSVQLKQLAARNPFDVLEPGHVLAVE